MRQLERIYPPALASGPLFIWRKTLSLLTRNGRFNGFSTPFTRQTGLEVVQPLIEGFNVLPTDACEGENVVVTWNAIDNPPATGRAALRARFIRAAKQHRRDFTVDWQHLKLNDRRPGAIVLSDPIEHTNSRVDRLIAEIERSETEP